MIVRRHGASIERSCARASAGPWRPKPRARSTWAATTSSVGTSRVELPQPRFRAYSESRSALRSRSCYASEATPRALAYRQGYSLRELASVLGVHYSTVSRRLKAEEAALGLR